MNQNLYDRLVISFSELKGISQRDAAQILINAVRDFQETIKMDRMIRETITKTRNKSAIKESE